MKAVQIARFGGPEVLEIVEAPVPAPAAGQIRVSTRAASVNVTDTKVRKGLLGGEPPISVGSEVSGIVDEIGDGVADVTVGDRVFGFADGGAGAAEFALMTYYEKIPASLDFVTAAALPVALEVATRALDALGVATGTTLLINGAAGGIGSAATQLAIARGARVIGIDAPHRLDHLRALGATAVVAGDDLRRRVDAVADEGVDRALDIAGNDILPLLVDLTGDTSHVVTIADLAGAERTGVRFSRGEDGRAIHALRDIGPLVESGEFTVELGGTFPLERIADAHRAIDSGVAAGKLVLTVEPRG